MILPKCEHDRKNMPKAVIFTCIPDYEIAVRANLINYADCLEALRLEKALVELRGKVQQLEADIQDMKNARRTTFVRCGCGRLKEVHLNCRGCGV